MNQSQAVVLKVVVHGLVPVGGALVTGPYKDLWKFRIFQLIRKNV